jgi:hypothetical protein
MRVPLTA